MEVMKAYDGDTPHPREPKRLELLMSASNLGQSIPLDLEK